MTEEQQKAVDTTDRSVVVSANAGSGKTSTMVQRLVSIVLQKQATVDEILALTFTRSASMEMKQRLANELEKLLSDEKYDKKYIENQINELNVSDICSLDSFCQKLIKKYFYTLDIDPNFAIIDEVEAGYLKSNALQSTLIEFGEMQEFRNLTQVLKDTKKLENITKQITKFSKFLFSLVDYNDFIKKVTNKTKIYDECVKFVLQRFKVALLGFKEQFNFLKIEVLANDWELLKSNINLAVEFCDLFDKFTLDEMSAFKKFPLFKYSSTKKGRTEEELALQKTMQLLTDDFDKEMQIFRIVFCNGDIVQMVKHYDNSYASVETLCKLTNRYIEKYAELKEMRNVLDFTDLEDKAIEILKQENVRNEVKNHYKFVCIDEFQDTNEKQSVLLSYICGENNSFFVGDPKQSIYNFRQCDLNIFVSLIEQFQNDDSKVAMSFNQNFRSHKQILQYVNEVFSKIMTKQATNIDYENENQFEKLRCLRLKLKGKLKVRKAKKVNYVDRVKIFVLHKKKKGLIFEKTFVKKEIVLKICKLKKRKFSFKNKSAVYSVLGSQLSQLKYVTTSEGQIAVDYILDFFKKKIKIIDPETKLKRKVKFSDFAILLRSHSKIKEYVDVFKENNIPVSAKVKINLVEEPHIAVLINTLRAISNPKQDYPLACSLKLLGGFDEEELFEIRQNYQDGFFYQAVDNYIDGVLQCKLENFKKQLQELRTLSKNFNVSYLLRKIIFDTNYENQLLSREDGFNNLSQLNLFLFKLETKSFNQSCDEFLQFIDNYSSAFEVEFSTVSSDNCVKITTIHDSKGLEFPITIVGGCGKAFKLSNLEDFIYTKNLGLGCVSADLEKRIKQATISQYANYLQKLTDEILEEMRILYVAMTRPKEYLALIGEEVKLKEERKLDVLKARTFFDFVLEKD